MVLSGQLLDGMLRITIPGACLRACNVPSENDLIGVPLICYLWKQLCSRPYPHFSLERGVWGGPAVSASSGLTFVAEMAVKTIFRARQHMGTQALRDALCLKA